MIRPSLLAAALALLAAAPAPAQTRLNGTVVDDATGQPIAGARVEILDWGYRRLALRVSDAQGGFTYTFSRPNSFRIRASRVGYTAALTAEFATGRHEYLNVQVRLASDAVLLAPLAVMARGGSRSSSPMLDGFRARRRSGLGTFYTREEISRLRPSRLSDLVLRTPGFYVAGSGLGGQLYSSRASAVPRDCPVQIYVDGFLVNPRARTGEVDGMALDDAVHPSDVEGVEIYRGMSTVPAQFFSPDAQCAVIVVWTRRGGNRS